MSMKLSFKGDKISFTRELSKLDQMALTFSERLSAAGIRHIVLSGYVAILFGRNRTSEDIDVICEHIPFTKFGRVWADIHRTFECIITTDARSAYYEYLANKTAIRFACKGEFIPNVELKFASTEMHLEALARPLEVLVNGRHLPTAPLEQQIAYKLFMASEKDIEDARFLFKLFEQHLDKVKLAGYLKTLRVPLVRAKRYLGWCT